VDGDMLLHPKFIGDHRRAARRGTFVQGTRILLDDATTRDALARGPRVHGAFSPGLGGLRRCYAMRAPRLAPLVSRIGNSFIAVKGCNQGYWRADAVHVNGFDDTMLGWGCEDKEFAARLTHAGIERRSLLFAGIAWHLHHPPAPRDRHAANQEILARTLRERRVRCHDGIVSTESGAS
jgi:N-terminal domain of galactosyltransferase